jgi:CheY-like chemotaxis protein/two-component sensor histidine kinase
MESIGQLTGGLAHDFNNLLSPIVGALDLLHRRGLADSRMQRLVEGAIESAERARVLVQRLLAFARRQPLQTGPVDVGMLIRSLSSLVESTVGPRTVVDLAIENDLPLALADANQLEMAILNLAVNARDAMPKGGQLRLAVELVQTSSEDELPEGHYILVTVADTGVGMNAKVVERAVEPFFTTKGSQRGTGLGLSMVHGLTAQLGGDMRITSAPGEGTSIALRLPVAVALPERGKEDVDPGHGDRQQAGTALLVDDEPLVRAGTAQALTEIGFAVIQAGSAEEAIQLIEEHWPVDLVVTDHLMPGMTGAELARLLATHRPGLPVLIISGYADVNDIAPEITRLAKPFRLEELERVIASLMRNVGADA